MSKGDICPSEKGTITDHETGVTFTRLTNHLCHSSHLYFTHWPYYDGCRKMLIHSDRGNAHNLYGIDIESGEIRQLTGFEPGEKGAGAFSACVSRVRDVAYFWTNRVLRALDLHSLEESVVWEAPHGDLLGPPNCSADGEFVYYSMNQDMADSLPMDLLRGYVGFQEYWAARPRCRIFRVSVNGGDAEMLWEEDNWIGHINCSPTVPNVLTFCHEGPWTKVDHRMWCLDAEAKKAWKVRPEPDMAVIGHEYWFEDGSRVGFHGRPRDGGCFWGHADWKSDDHVEYDLTRKSTHFQSVDDSLIVSDGSRDDPYIILWKPNGSGYDGALLCRHRGSFHTQRVHVHPTITPDKKAVIFTSDLGDYGNVYYVELPDFGSLPSV